jgi:hypothetical protein
MVQDADIEVGDDRQDPIEQQRNKKADGEHEKQAAGDMVDDDLTTGRSLLNQTPIEWVSKRQATDELSALRSTHRMHDGRPPKWARMETNGETNPLQEWAHKR